jgi:multidrug resistance efflux pump
MAVGTVGVRLLGGRHGTPGQREHLVTRAKVARKVRVRGILEARHVERVVSRTGGVIDKLPDTGTPVKKGDVVLGMDTDIVKWSPALVLATEARDIEKLELEREAAQAEMRRLRADTEKKVAHLGKKLATAELSLRRARAGITPFEDEQLTNEIQIAELAVQGARDALAHQQRLHEAGVVTAAALEPFEKRVAAAKLALAEKQRELVLRREEQAREKVAAIEAEIALDKAAMDDTRAGMERKLREIESSIAVTDIQLEMKRTGLEKTRSKRTNAIVRAGIDGLFQVLEFQSWKSGDRWSPYTVGMETRDPGTHFANVLDTREMDIQLAIHQSDLAGLAKGMRTEIVLPAYPGRTFTGELTHFSGTGYDRYDLAPRGHDREPAGVVVCRGTVSFDSQGMRLWPGMSALVDLVLGDAAGALVIPRSAVRRNRDRVLAIRKGERRAEEVEISGAPVDELLFAVAGGLEEGDTVLDWDTTAE